MGKIEVLDTPAGKVLKALLKSGVKLGISSRGLGTVVESGGVTMVEDDFQLICFDIVSEPSTPGAYLNVDASVASPSLGISLNEEKGPLTKEQRVANALNEILGD